MLDIKLIKKDPKLMQEKLAKKGVQINFVEILEKETEKNKEGGCKGYAVNRCRINTHGRLLFFFVDEPEKTCFHAVCQEH